MKLFGLFAAVGLVAGATLGTAAPAQERVVTRTTTTTVHRDAGWRPVAVRHRHKICRNRWHNGHRVRRCTWR